MLIDKINETVTKLKEDEKNSFEYRLRNLSEEKKAQYDKAKKNSIPRLFVAAALLFVLGFLLFLPLIVALATSSKYGDGTIAALIFGVNSIILAIALMLVALKRRKMSDSDFYRERLVSEDTHHTDEYYFNTACDMVVEDFLKSKNFSYTAKIPVITVNDTFRYIFIDQKLKRVMYINLVNDYENLTVDFNDIVSYEIYEDGKTVLQSRTGSVVLGGVLFGVPGMLVAQNRKREVQKPITQLKLVIRFNNFRSPQLVINFIDNNLNYKSSYYSKKLNDIYENLRYIYSNLEIIKHEQTQNSKEEIAETSPQNNLKEELLKLKELLDDGLITQEEYDIKKKKLLNI